MSTTQHEIYINQPSGFDVLFENITGPTPVLEALRLQNKRGDKTMTQLTAEARIAPIATDLESLKLRERALVAEAIVVQRAARSLAEQGSIHASSAQIAADCVSEIARNIGTYSHPDVEVIHDNTIEATARALRDLKGRKRDTAEEAALLSHINAVIPGSLPDFTEFFNRKRLHRMPKFATAVLGSAALLQALPANAASYTAEKPPEVIVVTPVQVAASNPYDKHEPGNLGPIIPQATKVAVSSSEVAPINEAPANEVAAKAAEVRVLPTDVEEITTGRKITPQAAKTVESKGLGSLPMEDVLESIAKNEPKATVTPKGPIVANTVGDTTRPKAELVSSPLDDIEFVGTDNIVMAPITDKPPKVLIPKVANPGTKEDELDMDFISGQIEANPTPDAKPTTPKVADPEETPPPAAPAPDKGTPKEEKPAPAAPETPPAPAEPAPKAPEEKPAPAPENPEAIRDASFKQIVAVNTGRNPKAMDPNVLATILSDTSRKYNHAAITREYILALLVQESRLDPNIVNANSGAQGLGQFMPATAGELGLTDPFNPEAAVDASFRYNIKIYDMLAKKMPNKSQDELIKLTLAGYNAGPYRSDVQSGAIPPIGETIEYVRIITEHLALIHDVENADVEKAKPKVEPKEKPKPKVEEKPKPKADEMPKFTGEWLPVVPKGTGINSEFGPRGYDANGKPVIHNGMDFAAPIGTPFYATAGGRITFTEIDVRDQQFCIDAFAGLGKSVDTIANPIQKEARVEMTIGSDTYVFVYAHLDAFNPDLVNGGIVQAGQEVGKTGNSGCSDGPHAHLTVYKNGVAINPRLLDDDPKWKLLAQGSADEKPKEKEPPKEEKAAQSIGQEIVARSEQFDEYGYLWGGGYDQSAKKFMEKFKAGKYEKGVDYILDCGGYVRMSVYDATGVDIGPLQFNNGPDTVVGSGNFVQVDFDKAQPGDVFAHVVNGLGHVGIIKSIDTATHTYVTKEALNPYGDIADNLGEQKRDYTNPNDIQYVYRYVGETKAQSTYLQTIESDAHQHTAAEEQPKSIAAEDESTEAVSEDDGLLKVDHTPVYEEEQDTLVDAETTDVDSGVGAESQQTDALSTEEEAINIAAQEAVERAKRTIAIAEQATKQAQNEKQLASAH